MLQRAGGSLAGVEDGEGGAVAGREKRRRRWWCGVDRSVWHMWMGAGGVDGELMVAGCVYACLGGGTVDSLLSQHPNIMLVKKKITRETLDAIQNNLWLRLNR